MAQVRQLTDRLVMARESLTITQRKAAERLGVDRSLISKHERGILEPGASILARYCDIYRVRAEWLLLGIGEIREVHAVPKTQRETQRDQELRELFDKIKALSMLERIHAIGIIEHALALASTARRGTTL